MEHEKEIPKERKRLSVNVKEFTPQIPLNEVVKEDQPKPNKGSGHEEVGVNTLLELVHNLNVNHNFEFSFLRLPDYSNLDKIRDTFSCLQNINSPLLDLSKYQNAYFFILRSSAYDDIHKAMKYGIWTSTPDNIKLLSETYRKAQEEKKKVVLFFRVATENVLNGAAELVSDYIEDQQFDVWWSKIKWRGIFNVKWIYVKNVDLNYLSHSEGDRKIYELIDGSPLSADNGQLLLGLFQHYEYKYQSSIFYFFSLFDQREDALINSRTSTDFQFKLQKREPKKQIAEHHTPARKKSGVHPSSRKQSFANQDEHAKDNHHDEGKNGHAKHPKNSNNRKTSGVYENKDGHQDEKDPKSHSKKKSAKKSHKKSGHRYEEEIVYVKKEDPPKKAE